MKLRRENWHIEVQKEIVKIIAFHSRQRKIWSFHLAVVPGWQSTVQERVVILLIKPIFLDVAVAFTIVVTSLDSIDHSSFGHLMQCTQRSFP